ncbi:MAG: nucleoside triphosphate pyrophosphohydrolase [Bacillota bacterium]
MGNKIIIVGLGPGDPGMLTMSAMKILSGSQNIWLRTEIHPVVGWIKEEGISFRTFDYIYGEEDNFQEVYQRISREIISLASKGDVVYGVPGHPMVAEESVELILDRAKSESIPVEVVPGMSFLDSLFKSLKINPARGFHIIDGLRMEEERPDPQVGTVVTQAYSRLVLSDIKLSLMEYYPDEHIVTVITAAGVPGEENVVECPLYDLDRVDVVNHLTSIYLPPYKALEGPVRCFYPLDPLVEVMERLRGENGCPWDREQDHLSLRKYLIEEAYEVTDALERQEMYNICEELGDLLLQIVFHAQIASENAHFNVNDVIRNITEKMIRRHPHVFGDVKVENSEEVLVNWAAIKNREKGTQKVESVLGGIPVFLPSLMRAQRIQEAAAKVGFDWPDYQGALQKIYEELSEIREAITSGSGSQKEDELGDVLFSVINLSRLIDIDAEVALAKTINKFLQRFKYIEQKACESGRALADCSLDEMDFWWEEVKKQKKV